MLCGTYPILLGSQQIGTATVKRTGLYYRFSCSCNLSEGTVYRLFVKVGDRTENLGIPVPQDGALYLDTAIAAKRLGEGELTLWAQTRHSLVKGKFVPLSPEEPFAYISRLEKAVLQRRGSAVGVVVPDDD